MLYGGILTKKPISIISFFIILTGLFFISGCNSKSIIVNTALNIDSSFCGNRTISLEFPKDLVDPNSAQAINLEETIFKSCPNILTFEKNQNTNTTIYTFTLNFDSATDYISKIETLTSRPVTVNFFCGNTPLTNGLRCEEDFDSKELFSWLYNACKNGSNLSSLDINLKCAGTKLVANGKEFWTSNKISVSNVNFQPVEKISIYTKNNFDGTFNRTIKFSFSKETVNSLGNKLTEYMAEKTPENIGSCGWIYLDGAREYIISYTNLNLDELSQYTNSIFNTDSCHKICYQTDINQSTLFKKVDVFQDSLDLSAFSSDEKNVNLEYKYDTATEKAKQYLDGQLQDIGELCDNSFCLNTKTSGLRLYIPNSTDYKIEGIDFKLNYLENNNFEKSIYLKYNKDDKEPISYTQWYLNEKNIDAEQETYEAGSNNIYKILKIGNPSEISQLGKDVFGDGNSVSYTFENYNFNIHNSTKIKDNVRLSKILTGGNKTTPITYIVSPNNICTVSSLEYMINKRKIRANTKLDSNGNINISLPRSDFDLICNGRSVNQINAILAFLLTLVVLLSVICVILYVRHKKSKHG
ncbi:MAG: hypothetical protein RUMPE_00823 [Eubacteriales bacterium SKADARSKE-1]|nr:hypothetical protein [Eubacteriales bacterium SKADARSKE-1]